MGMYTELILGCELNEDTPESVIKVLDYMVNGNMKEVPSDFPEEIEPGLLRHCSYSFGVCEPNSKFWKDDISKAYHISTRSSIKNYHNQIETFLEWLKPYIYCGSGYREMYAIVMYEEQSEPTIYYLDKYEEEE